MWRPARDSDDDQIATFSLALYAEDPSPHPVDRAQVLRTLAAYRAEPRRGQALGWEEQGVLRGHALLTSYWSNELGGEVCLVDELYLEPAFRSGGRGSSLFELLASRRGSWPGEPVAIGLEVTPANARARGLYERLGFRGKNLLMHRRTSG